MTTVPLNESAPVALDGWLAASGSVTSPAGFAILATTPVLVPGTYIVSWTVTLAGTLASADTNNFQLVDQIVPASTPVGGVASSYNFLAQSVNADTAGSYPQAPFTLTVTAPTQLGIAAAPHTPTSGSVYSASLPAQGGNGTAQIGPSGQGETWNIAVVHVKTNQLPAAIVNESQCFVYAGSQSTDQHFADSTSSGSTGDSTDSASAYPLRKGEFVWAVWKGGDAGAEGIVRVTGTKDI